MLVLGIDTATLEGGVVVTNDGQLIATAASLAVTMKGHSKGLLGLIGESLEKVGISADKLDLIAVSTGPGSFTGIRVGLGVALGLSDSLGIKITGVSTLTALARSRIGWDGGYICPVVHAMKNEVYTALFVMNDGRLKRLTDDMAISPKSLAEMIDRPTCFIGDGYEKNKDVLDSLISHQIEWARPVEASCSAGVALEASELAMRGELTDSPLVPNYARASQAEINWGKIHNSTLYRGGAMSLEPDNRIVSQLLDVNEEFKRLYKEHGDLNHQVTKIAQRKVMTAEDEVELHRLKKIKLAGKDRMLQIMATQREHNA